MFGFTFSTGGDALLAFGGSDRIDTHNDVWSVSTSALEDGFALVRDGAKKRGGIMGIGGKSDMFR